MQITYHLTWKDAWQASRYFSYKSPSILIFYGITLIPIFYVIWSDLWEYYWSVVTIALFAVLLTLTAVLEIFIFVNALYLSKTKGVLGEHTIVINKEGLRETTSFNDTLHYWGSIVGIFQNKQYIFIKLNQVLVHVIPRQSFPSQEEDERFYQLALQYWSHAK